MSEGYAQFHRKLLLNPISNKPNYLAVWVYIVLNANHTTKQVIINNAKMTINRGEYLGSLQKISLHFNLSIASVKKIVDYFESEKMVNTKRTRNYTIFQVVSYDQYQTSKHKKNTKRTPSETTNNDNNENNENKIVIPDFVLPEFKEDFARMKLHRLEKKKPMTSGAETLLHNTMIKFKAAGCNITELVDYSIMKGYETIYMPDKDKPNYNSQQPAGKKHLTDIMDTL